MILEQWIGIGIWVLSFVYLVFLIKPEKGNILNDLKGSDGKWDVEDLVPLLWFALTPLIIFCSLVLKMDMSTGAWTAYDLVGVISFGSKVALGLTKKQKDDV